MLDSAADQIATEAELALLAAALTGDQTLTTAESQVSEGLEAAVESFTEAVRREILFGRDPLGSAFIRLRSPEDRRQDGAVFTPDAIIDSMIAWAARQNPSPKRVVDPGSGSGRYLFAAAAVFPDAELVAVETDPLCRLMILANATVLGLRERLTIVAGDYRDMRLRRIVGPTLFIGNPPYVRHHAIPERWKAWLASTASTFGFKASKLAGLHIHFFLQTRALGVSGDYGAFITSAEWIDVNYGALLRQLLADGLGGSSLHLIAPESMPFKEAMTTGAITCFKIGNRPKHLHVSRVERLADLGDLSGGQAVAWKELSAGRWSIHIRNAPRLGEGQIELGELFRVQRGQVTGANAIWVESASAPDVPERYKFPSVTKARDLFAAGESLTHAEHLRRVIDLPINLDEIPEEDRSSVESFLTYAKANDAHSGYVARARKAWWSVGLKDAAPILCTYMARRPPAFVRNPCGARHLNIAHGLYPRQAISAKVLDRLLEFLKHGVNCNQGRTYAGGLVKFEPREVERIPVPSPENLLAQ